MDNIKKCGNCKYGMDYGDSVEYIHCERTSRKKDVKKIDMCDNYEEINDIKGVWDLDFNQFEHMINTHKRHVETMEAERKEKSDITECWIDVNNIVCVRLKSGEWYRYYPNMTWGQE